MNTGTNQGYYYFPHWMAHFSRCGIGFTAAVVLIEIVHYFDLYLFADTSDWFVGAGWGDVGVALEF